MLYLETSAVLRAALLNQSEVVARMSTAAKWGTSALTLLECERTLIAMRGARRLTTPQRARAHAYLRDVVWRTEIAELDGWILERAGQPFPVEPVRSLDAIHLATVLRWAELGSVDVLTCDSRVMQNAKALGLRVSYFPDEPRR